ncbi:hypothetical protein WA158_003392 [Blastocystis sp. Blastoise]
MSNNDLYFYKSNGIKSTLNLDDIFNFDNFDLQINNISNSNNEVHTLNQIAENPVDNIQENDIMNSLVNSFLKKKKKLKTLTEDIEEDIFACWILLGISEAKTIYLYTLANKIMKKLRNDITALPIPHNGQDILSKMINQSNTKVIYRNIYIYKICNNINTFNNGRKNPFLSNIQCNNPLCNNNILLYKRYYNMILLISLLYRDLQKTGYSNVPDFSFISSFVRDDYDSLDTSKLESDEKEVDSIDEDYIIDCNDKKELTTSSTIVSTVNSISSMRKPTISANKQVEQFDVEIQNQIQDSKGQHSDLQNGDICHNAISTVTPLAHRLTATRRGCVVQLGFKICIK